VPAEGAETPAAVAVGGEGAVAEPADGEGAEGPVAAVTLAGCLEPKMADTMFPKTLIFVLLLLLLFSGQRLGFLTPWMKVAPE
jgi:hypothetical protein